MKRRLALAASPALAFVLTMGLVNLFADVTYEGGASLNGQYMAMLGAGAAVTSIIAGVGEFLGYALRSVSGYVADRTGKYWRITFAGYVVNLLAVPAMALAGNWKTAGALILAERVGRAMRKPTVESMISYTTTKLGTGWAYALNTALDETGATVGPLLMALVLLRGGSPRAGYGWLIVSAVLALVALTAARTVFPMPSRLEEGRTAGASGFTRTFWLSMIAAAFFGAGLMSFELIGYHLSSARIVSPHSIPLLLALSTAGGVIASLVLGRLYDRAALPVLLSAVVVSACFSPLVFLGSGFVPVLAGMLLWGVGYAVQDTLLKAVVAGQLPEGRRNTAFGLFYAGYGVGWLVGSVAAGLLYERSRVALVVFSVAVQLLSLPVFAISLRRLRTTRG
jgi:predicted MFS family arabinose efflux permease